MKSFLPKPDLGFMRFHDIAGESRPLIFVHGLGCASSCDYPVVAAHLLHAKRRMIMLDLLGFGFSDRPTRFAYRISDHADTLVAFIQSLGVPKVDVYGHSMGGSIAISAATRIPELIGHLLVSEPNLTAGGGAFSRMIAAYSETEYVARGHQEILADQAGSVWAGSMAAAAPLAVHRSAASLVAGVDPSWHQQLRQLAIPKTLIFGEHSLPDADAENVQKDGMSLLVVPGAGHSMASENPLGLARTILPALGEP